MKKITVLMMLCLSLLTQSCSSTNMGTLANVGATSGVAALTYKALEGNKQQLGYTVGAAGLTYLAGNSIINKIEKTKEDSFANGYTEAMADATILQHEMMLNQQKGGSTTQTTEYEEYTFPGTENKEGVNLVPHSVKLRVVK